MPDFSQLLIHGGRVPATALGQGLEDDLWKSVLSFHHVGSGGLIAAVKLGKSLYPLSYLTSSFS